MEELIKYMKALITVQLHHLERADPDAKPVKPDVLLSRAGLTNKEIGRLLGKTEEAVKKTIQRAKNAATVTEQAEAGS